MSNDSRIFLFSVVVTIGFLSEYVMICAFPASNFLILVILKRYRGQSGSGSCAVARGWVRAAAFTIGRWHGNGELERLTTATSPFLYCAAAL